MAILEKYPDNIPGDLHIEQQKYKSIQWVLAKAGIVYTFTRSRIDSNYVYIQKNDEEKKLSRNTKHDLHIKDYLMRVIR